MTINEIIDWLSENHYEFKYRGQKDFEVLGFASLISCELGRITWVKKQENYLEAPDKDKVSLAVVQEGLKLDIPNQIVTPNSKNVFFAILHHFWGCETVEGYIGEGTVIEKGAQVCSSSYIGHNCSISKNVYIGEHCIIEDNVVIRNTRIGDNCIIHSGAVIGTDGFGYAFDELGLPVKVEHFGRVEIGNRVEIGANSCIDRGTIDDTIICDDVKMDNLVHIGHNGHLGKGTIVTAGAVFSGSVHTGENSYIAPGSVIMNQITIGANSFTGLGAVVTHSVDSGVVVAGVPAKTIRKVKPGDK